MLKKLLTRIRLARLRSNISALENFQAEERTTIQACERNIIEAQHLINLDQAKVRRLMYQEQAPAGDLVFLKRQAD